MMQLMPSLSDPRRWRIERNGNVAWAGSWADLLWYGDDATRQDRTPRPVAQKAPVWTATIGLNGPVIVSTAAGPLTAPGFLVPPGVEHRVQRAGASLTVWIEPGEIDLGGATRTLTPAAVHGLVNAFGPEAAASGERDMESDRRRALQRLGSRAVAPDVRLSPLLADLEHVASLTDAAARVGLSPRRLRQLAEHSLGGSLLNLRRWRRFRAAAMDLPFVSAAEAASAHGFADQSHLVRTCSKFAGATPSASPASAYFRA